MFPPIASDLDQNGREPRFESQAVGTIENRVREGLRGISSSSIAEATAGDGTYAGSRKLYLEQALRMTPLERLRAVDELNEAALLIQKAAARRVRR